MRLTGTYANFIPIKTVYLPQIKRTNHKKDMKVHEYQAKLLFKDYGLPVVDQNILCRTVEEAVQAYKKIGDK